MMNGYDISRNFWNWAFENTELMSPNLAAIYFIGVEHCHRHGGEEKFGIQSQMTMDAVGISKYQTYSKYFNQLVDYGFIKVIQKSKNQYSANIILLPNASPKKGKALDKAFIKHGAKQTESIGQSMYESDGSIVKQYNKGTNKQINNSDLFPVGKEEIFTTWLDYRKEIKKPIKSERTLKSLAKKFNEHDLRVCEQV